MTRLTRISLLACMAASVAASANAQSLSPGTVPGFTVQAFIAEVSLFLPPEVFPSNARQGQGPARTLFARDPKLYLTKEQVDKVLPIAVGLKENPMPSPAKAKKIQAELDALLDPAQKAEFADYRKALDKIRKEARQKRSDQGQQQPDSRSMTNKQSQLQRRQRLAESFLKALEAYRKLY